MESDLDILDETFRTFSWVDRAKSFGLTPVLVYRNRTRTHIDLWLAEKRQDQVPDANGSVTIIMPSSLASPLTSVASCPVLHPFRSGTLHELIARALKAV